MFVSLSCSWCHAINASDALFCKQCGHEAHKARLHCRCPKCVAAIELWLKGEWKPTLAYGVGDRVIFTSPDHALDGLRGTVTAVYDGGYYDVKFEEGVTWMWIWESKLDREADNPDYPQPSQKEQIHGENL